MNQPIFLKATLTEGNAVVWVALPGQSHKINNIVQQIDPTMQVTSMSTQPSLIEGQIWATNRLVPKKNSHYVAGPQLIQLTDDMGMVNTEFPTPEDDEEDFGREWAQAYIDFTHGRQRVADQKTAPAKDAPPTILHQIVTSPSNKPPTIEDDGWYVEPELWYDLIYAYKKCKQISLFGPSGAGKTDLMRLFSRKTGTGLDIFNMAITNPNKMLCGNLTMHSGDTAFKLARFAKQIKTPGIALLDELSRAAPTANNTLIPVMDGRRTLYIEDSLEDEDIEILLHPERAIWATANVGAQFVGTYQLDHALLNRMKPQVVNYPPKDKESLLLQKVWKLNKFIADEIVDIADATRTNPDLSKDVSTRQVMEMGEMIHDGYTPYKAFEKTCLFQYESDKTDGGERQQILALLQSLSN